MAIQNANRLDFYREDYKLKKNLSKNGYHFLVDFISGPGYGLDKNSMSLGHFAIFAYYAFREKEKLLWKPKHDLDSIIKDMLMADLKRYCK